MTTTVDTTDRRRCRKCDCLTGPGNIRKELPVMGGRRLCGPCYAKANRDGTLHKWPPVTRRREDVLADWYACKERERGCSIGEAARLMGMTPKALDMALRRARRAGLLESA